MTVPGKELFILITKQADKSYTVFRRVQSSRLQFASAALRSKVTRSLREL
jgi:hypothetical protein